VAAAAAYQRSKGKALGVIWVDAHGDMNTPQTSDSGNVHGMPLAALLGAEPAELARVGGSDGPAIDAQHTVLVGIRNLDDIEKQLVRQSQVHVFTMKDVDRLGITQVMEKALAIACRDTGGVHISFDMDVCDPAIAPGVGTPVKGGLDYREAHVVMEMAAECGHVMSLDLVELNPTLDMRNMTAELGTELALSAMGKQIL
jgi:arginase